MNVLLGVRMLESCIGKTYMPPQHLWGVSQPDADSGKVTITDLAGASLHPLHQPLCDTKHICNTSYTMSGVTTRDISALELRLS
ncbi:hypothetical protein JAAARDRAFT_346525 [Jaapia argillacea MUCL 33604]|uniref:Uncharacterized protein n=1 Tax=Jaapia argillacea MUCL 33604 TaxID=933084 RepID=A0A067PVG9_9AGAM|nr:hypothetical protein JAAARDRAFT_346525 [Jaapia argillacea MUCL 33604]